MITKKTYLIGLCFFLIACSGAKEVIMPFKNIAYSGERLFPIKSSNAKKCFRIWINNSTSIDRILTIYQDTLFGTKAKLVEIGKRFKNKREIEFYNEIETAPKSGFENFFRKLDSLNVIREKNRAHIPIALHQPLSIYVVEYKNEELYNQFRFETVYPAEPNKKTNYESIENLIFQEFAIPFYLK